MDDPDVWDEIAGGPPKPCEAYGRSPSGGSGEGICLASCGRSPADGQCCGRANDEDWEKRRESAKGLDISSTSSPGILGRSTAFGSRNLQSWSIVQNSQTFKVPSQTL